MRGDPVPNLFLVEKSACRPDALLLPPRWPIDRPHPTRLRRPTFPRGEGFGLCFLPVCKPLPAAAQPGRAVTGVRYRAAGQAKKEDLPGSSKPEQESRGENLSSGPLSPVSREKRGPRRVGALRGAAPRGLVRAPPTRRVRSTAPQKINLQTSIFNSIIKSR